MRHLVERRVQSGVSLIELMIALVIGTLLILGAIQVFAASRSAYMISEGIARVQENGRFALDFLQRDIRMAGHLGCVNDQAHYQNDPVGLQTTFVSTPAPELDFGVSIQGYEATGTAPAAATTLTISTTPTTGGRTTRLRCPQASPLRRATGLRVATCLPCGSWRPKGCR